MTTSTSNVDKQERAPRRLRVTVLLPLALSALIGVLILSSIYSTVAFSEETEDIFTDAAEIPPALIDEVQWMPDPSELPREMEPLTREDIMSSWLRAWEQLTIVSGTGETSGVDTYFSGSAREGVLMQAAGWDDRSLKQLGHELRVTFYSKDGQIVGLEAPEVRLERTRQTDDGLLVQSVVESYDAVLILEDGTWRVNHLVRTSYEAGTWTLAG